MVTCGFCGHEGAHATIAREVGGVRYCTGCPRCQEELRRLAEASPSRAADADEKSNEEGETSAT
jgi:hypothetical protein